MIDPFVILAPVLLLPVVALLRFAGCAAILHVDDVSYAPSTGTPKYRNNCGGSSVADPSGGMMWSGDADIPPGGTTTVLPKKDPNQSIQGVDSKVPAVIYDTARRALSNSFFYKIHVGSGNYNVNLKFAMIDANPNIGGDVEISINGTKKTHNPDANGLHHTHDLNDAFQNIAADASGDLTITFQTTTGRFAYVSGIEITS